MNQSKMIADTLAVMTVYSTELQEGLDIPNSPIRKIG